MKTQRISNQNFNGKIIYISKNGEKYTKNLTKRLPYVYMESESRLLDAVGMEYCDVFISRGKSPLHFNIWAGKEKLNTKPEIVKLKPQNSHPKRPSDYYQNPDDIEYAIYNSLYNFNIGKFSK